ncbi:hypothetical protein [Bacillus sp. FJAT-45350]|uniref:hypothetical protein n=1 Tax=Bacillus sp. FJAT-45350 TaxID=2011014 RepID=UPI000BB730CF|nr:hypothetical protein [Bacillus sp. FJAT-45350]
MTKRYIRVFSYILFLMIIIYFSIQSLIHSAMKPSFLNLQLILTIIVMFVLTWIVGKSLREYIRKTADGNKKIESNLKVSFVLGSLIATLCLYGLFIVNQFR